MWRRASNAALLGALALLAAWPAVGADDVASYLERHGLKQILALHLEEQLSQAAGEEKAALAVQLAELYADLLETTDDLSLRVDLENRSRELLTLVPEDSADDLRLALLRGGYAAAERLAENHRLRLGEADAGERAAVILEEAIPAFNALRSTLKQKLEAADRRLDRAGPAEQARQSEMAERVRRLHARCLFLNAWALYYQAWLRNRPENARAAIDLFGLILDSESDNIRPADVSRDLLTTEAIARTVLGIALCVALTEGPTRAESWLDLLEGENVFSAIRSQVPAWRLSMLLEQGEYRLAGSLLEEASATSADGEVPVVWIRLAAVHSLEAATTDAEAATLAQWSVASLAGRGELQQVLDLASRYGVEALGTSGFASLYVRGARVYQEARELHGDETPTSRPDLGTLYERAATHFSAAVAEPDAARFPVAAAGARLLIGWCLYFQGRFFQARDAFEQAASVLSSSEAPEALWMAIVCLDRVVNAEGGEAYQPQLTALVAGFLERFPASEYAPRLVLKQAEATGPPSIERVEELLAIPPGSETYETAQRRAAGMLYALFQNAAGDRRRDLGERYLNLAVPMQGRTEIATLLADEVAMQQFMQTARRTLEVSLTPGIDRAQAAIGAFSMLDDLERRGLAVPPDVAMELDYRRVQLALLGGSVAEAESFADRAWQREAASPWASAAVRTVFRQAVREWRALSPGSDDREVLARVIRYGGRALHEFDSKDASLDDEGVLTYYATVAEASFLVWQRSSDSDLGKAALLLYERLHEARPSNALFLRSVALLSPAFGNLEVALDCWRRLAAGTEEGADGWLEAKYNLILLLSESDPARAREVMDQYIALYPDFGPAPWGPRFLSLDAQIKKAGVSDADGGHEAQ